MDGYMRDKCVSKYIGQELKKDAYMGSIGLFLETATHDIFGTCPDRELFQARVEQKFRAKADVNFDKSKAIILGVTKGTYELVRLYWADAMYRWRKQPFH